MFHVSKSDANGIFLVSRNMQRRVKQRESKGNPRVCGKSEDEKKHVDKERTSFLLHTNTFEDAKGSQIWYVWICGEILENQL